MDRELATAAYYKVLENSRRMVQFLTILATESDHNKYLETIFEAKDDIPGLIMSLGLTMNGVLEWVAYTENTTLLEEIQKIALCNESLTLEQALEEWGRMDDEH